MPPTGYLWYGRLDFYDYYNYYSVLFKSCNQRSLYMPVCCIFRGTSGVPQPRNCAWENFPPPPRVRWDIHSWKHISQNRAEPELCNDANYIFVYQSNHDIKSAEASAKWYLYQCFQIDLFFFLIYFLSQTVSHHCGSDIARLQAVSPTELWKEIYSASILWRDACKDNNFIRHIVCFTLKKCSSINIPNEGRSG